MRFKSTTLTTAILLAACSYTVARLAAQSPQEPSIADAARQNRQQKKAAPQSGTVITNDTLNPSAAGNPKTATSPSPAPPVAASSEPSSEAPTPAGASASTPAAKSELSREDANKLKAEIATIKQELKDKQSEVELLQRLLNLDREALLSKPDSSRDADGKAKLDAEQQDLDQKIEQFEKLKAKLQSVAPELTAAGAPPKS